MAAKPRVRTIHNSNSWRACQGKIEATIKRNNLASEFLMPVKREWREFTKNCVTDRALDLQTLVFTNNVTLFHTTGDFTLVKKLS